MGRENAVCVYCCYCARLLWPMLPMLPCCHDYLGIERAGLLLPGVAGDGLLRANRRARFRGRFAPGPSCSQLPKQPPMPRACSSGSAAQLTPLCPFIEPGPSRRPRLSSSNSSGPPTLLNQGTQALRRCSRHCEPCKPSRASKVLRYDRIVPC